MSEAIPEKTLLVAVLEKAIFDKFIGNHIDKYDAERWLMQRIEQPFPEFSYCFVCEHLNICPATLRHVIDKLDPEEMKEKLKSKSPHRGSVNSILDELDFN